MSEKLSIEGNKERVALELMEVIVAHDKRAAKSLPEDAAKYYLTVYHSCLSAVYGQHASALQFADKR